MTLSNDPFIPILLEVQGHIYSSDGSARAVIRVQNAALALGSSCSFLLAANGYSLWYIKGGEDGASLDLLDVI